MRVSISRQIASSDQSLDRLVRRHLKIEARDRRRAHAEQREAALVERVDELVGGRRRLGENPEPAERVDALVDGEHAGWNRRPADAVKAIAAGDEIAVNLVFGAAVAEAERQGWTNRARRPTTCSASKYSGRAVSVARVDQIVGRPHSARRR